jgi:hypothetical protein
MYPTFSNGGFETSVVGIPASGSYQISTSITNLGESSANVYLTIGIVSVYKQVTGSYVRVQAVLDDGSYRTVTSQCAPPQNCLDSSFQFYDCSVNVPVTAYLRNEYGGSLLLQATLMLGGVLEGADYCIYRPTNTTSVAGYFFMNYVVSNYVQPTSMPTPAGGSHTLSPTLPVSCAAGQYLTSANTCVACPSYLWSNAGQTACSVCPAGSYLSNSGERIFFF